MQVVPEASRHDMAQRIGEIVRHHLGLAARARGEIHQRDIVVAIRMGRAREGRGVGDAPLEILETFRYLRAYGYHRAHAGRLGEGVYDMFGNHLLARANDHLDIGGVRPVHDILLGQQVRGGDHYRPQFMQGDDGEPELIATFQDQHHHIAPSDS